MAVISYLGESTNCYPLFPFLGRFSQSEIRYLGSLPDTIQQLRISWKIGTV